MKHVVRLLILVVLFGTLTAITAHLSPKQYSASLSTVSVTLSNSRLSFRGALKAGNSTGSTIAYINTTPNSYPSTASSQLVQGDTVRIGDAGTLGLFTVDDSYNNPTTAFLGEDKIYLSAGLAAGQADAGDDVISTQSAQLTTKLTTVDAIANGRFRILVPALANDAASSDGIPDGGYYDFTTATPAVTCPGDVAGTYDFVAGTATKSAILVGSTEYHSFECAYSGTGANGTLFNGISQGSFVVNSLINPAPTTNHQLGVADTYRIIIQHLDSNFISVDQTTVAIGVIEAVKVTASVAPQITFKIIGVNSGSDVCGLSTSVSTSAALVPFGDLLISSFTQAAQAFSISTNASAGYSVTALENDQMGRNGATCTGATASTDCIPDTPGDATNITAAVAGLWTSTNTKGFGFTLDNKNAVANLTLPFQHDTNTTVGGQYTCTGNSATACTGGQLCHCFRSFADAENSGTAQVIGSATIPVDNHNFYLCYRGVISTTQAAGYYENYVTYIATATF
ncbi:hypothetical protein KA078_01925 [Candidatus Woesebacteria bacterium]|nr:hypothetical protein [Candidatus Woesebacteria bacterium]